ncbi:MAG: valine--tRNA ligase [Candidatus Dormibacteria bacterium]
MDKAFDFQSVEPRWRRRWEELNVGRAEPSSPRPAFTIALPPPNITGALHLGHAAGFSVQDVLARNRRMRGFEVEWCPGTDHAAIATQNVIERELAAEGTSKEELGREGFQRRVDAWYADYGGKIFEQMRRLGFTCDWSRARFTLDEGYVRAIRLVFKRLYDERLIYRGPRIVNWCPRCRSAISDEEVEWKEHRDSLVTLRYPVEGGATIDVATVRPETMLGDTAVAVAPGHPRYASLVGRHVVLPLSDRRVPIIEDAAVRSDFGTGALKVTPGHDPLDNEIGRRHLLPTISVIALDGTMDVKELPQFHGAPVETARVSITRALRELGVVVAEEEYTHDVGHCDRCHHVLEPLISEQWWVRMPSLAAPAITAVESGEISFHPANYTDVYLSWMRNIRDWCISRQLWLGHAIPVSTCANGHEFTWVDEPETCPVCGDRNLRPDTDVLDTWFSSALWPYAIFGWPEQTEELRRFYPTDALVTAREIIFLWVARMIMTGVKFAGARPFSDVLITSTIMAADGSRMQKSRGNAVDPLAMIERYGADAVRAWAAAVATSGQDVRFDEDRIASYKNFANKLWSVTRLLATRLGDGERIPRVAEVDPSTLFAEDRWILDRVAAAVEICDAAIATYQLHHAMERLYATTWHGLCDWYVEMVKPRLAEGSAEDSRAAAAWTLVTALDILLRALYPFMPLVTEECAQHMDGAAASLQQRTWPEGLTAWRTAADQRDGVEEVLELVQRLRAARQDGGVPARSGHRHPLVLRSPSRRLQPSDTSRLLEALVPVNVIDEVSNGTEAVVVVAGTLEAGLYLGSGGDDPARLAARLRELEARVERLAAQLENGQFMERAPAEVVDQARRRLAEATGQRDAIQRLVGGSN